jgi:hypothetical protein
MFERWGHLRPIDHELPHPGSAAGYNPSAHVLPLVPMSAASAKARAGGGAPEGNDGCDLSGRLRGIQIAAIAMAADMTLAAAIGGAVHRDKHPLGRVAGGTAATGPAPIDHRVARSRRGPHRICQSLNPRPESRPATRCFDRCQV